MTPRQSTRPAPSLSRGLPLVMGIDGGGSKTLALIADARGRIVGRGESGCSNHHVVGWAGAETALRLAMRAARRSAHLRGKVAALCIGTAGVDSASDAHRLEGWLDRERVADRLMTVNDGELLLAAGTPARIGVGLIAGTGSICFGRNGHGQVARAGGWGHLVGDEGSGYDLGMQALRLVLKTLDGRAAAPGLAKAVLRAVGARDAQGLLAFVYDPARRKTDFAALAPVVFRRAARGDADARALLTHAAADLAALVRAVARELSLRRAPLVVGGSLLVRQPLLREALMARLASVVSGVTVVGEPARGALVLARGLLSRP